MGGWMSTLELTQFYVIYEKCLHNLWWYILLLLFSFEFIYSSSYFLRIWAQSNSDYSIVSAVFYSALSHDDRDMQAWWPLWYGAMYCNRDWQSLWLLIIQNYGLQTWSFRNTSTFSSRWHCWGRYHVLTKCSTPDDGMLTMTESVRTIEWTE